MDERADTTDQSNTTPEPPAPRGDSGRDIAALVLSILSFVVLPVVGAVIAIALVGREVTRARTPMGSAGRIVAFLNLGLCSAVLLVLGVAMAIDHAKDDAAKSFEATGEAIGGGVASDPVQRDALETDLGCEVPVTDAEYAAWADKAMPSDLRVVLGVGDRYETWDAFVREATPNEREGLCQTFRDFHR